MRCFSPPAKLLSSKKRALVGQGLRGAERGRGLPEVLEARCRRCASRSISSTGSSGRRTASACLRRAPASRRSWCCSRARRPTRPLLRKNGSCGSVCGVALEVADKALDVEVGRDVDAGLGGHRGALGAVGFVSVARDVEAVGGRVARGGRAVDRPDRAAERGRAFGGTLRATLEARVEFRLGQAAPGSWSRW